MPRGEREFDEIAKCQKVKHVPSMKRAKQQYYLAAFPVQGTQVVRESSLDPEMKSGRSSENGMGVRVAGEDGSM